jgi:hypothetical protein
MPVRPALGSGRRGWPETRGVLVGVTMARDAPPSLNPYMFIVGCLRSGTTLLRRMVDAHPELAVIHETEWLPRFYERRIGVTAEGFVTPALIDRLYEHRKFLDQRIERQAVEAFLARAGPVRYAGLVSRIFDLYGEAQGKRLVGEKSPGYVRYLDTLHALWPGARVVHMVRDGRDVCLSVLDWKKGKRTAGRFGPWASDPVSTTALWWEWHVRMGREAATVLGPRLYHELRLESLAADPEAECQALCGFLGLSFDEAMLAYQEGRERRSWGRSARGRWLPPSRGLRDWRTEMGVEQLERFEAVAGELLGDLEYPRAVDRLGAAAMARAARAREEFTVEARSRYRRFPRGWGLPEPEVA